MEDRHGLENKVYLAIEIQSIPKGTILKLDPTRPYLTVSTMFNGFLKIKKKKKTQTNKLCSRAVTKSIEYI